MNVNYDISYLKGIDPSIGRKNKTLEEHLSKYPFIGKNIPTFSVVEFNITELCNRSCIFCPRSNPKIYQNQKKFIKINLYEKIMKDLGQVNYKGTVLYSAFSEPLLHKDLDQLLMLTKQSCPQSCSEIVTNGDFLDVDRIQRLFDSGLDTLYISLYDGPHQKEHFLKMKKEAGLKNDQLILRVRYLPEEQNFGLILNNRAGIINPLFEVIEEACFYPFYELSVDYDGSVLLCPQDWSKRYKIGDLNKQSIMEVWTDKSMTLARKRLAQKDRNFPPCNTCDVGGILRGRNHFNLWMKYYEGIK